MKVVQDQVGEATILIQVVDDDVINLSQDGNAFKPHGIEDKISSAFSSARRIVRSMAEDLANDIQSIEDQHRPKRVDVEFSLSLSTEGTLWVVTSKGEGALKIKLSWES